MTDSGETANLIFPIPTEAILPPPHRSREETSSTSSSSRKRRREGDNASETSHVPSLTRASSASDFSTTVKAKVRADYGNKCWHCSASPADVCHVIGSRDDTASVRDLTKHIFYLVRNSRSKMASSTYQINDIHITQSHSAELCHRNFDDTYNPNFFFVPTDLDYFFKYEKEDRKRRRKFSRRQGTIPARMCPTAQTYQNHQIQMGIQRSSIR